MRFRTRAANVAAVVVASVASVVSGRNFSGERRGGRGDGRLQRRTS